MHPSVHAEHLVPLDETYARRHSNELLELHNTIPHVFWSLSELLSTGMPGRPFPEKFALSVAAHSLKLDRPVDLLIAYVREPWEHFPHRSIYLHRGAVSPDFRGQGLGRRLFDQFLDQPKLSSTHKCNYLTVQTNIESSNAWLIKFYRRLGFNEVCEVAYPDKTDILMVYEWPSPTTSNCGGT